MLLLNTVFVISRTVGNIDLQDIEAQASDTEARNVELQSADAPGVVTPEVQSPSTSADQMTNQSEEDSPSPAPPSVNERR